MKYGIYGHYDDGSLTISGKLINPYILADDHDILRKSAEGDAWVSCYHLHFLPNHANTNKMPVVSVGYDMNDTRLM